MTSKRRREQEAPPPAGTRIRGRQRGFETVWTLDRFAEVIRNEVSKGIERAWPPDRIRSWIRTTYELDPRSLPSAAKAIDTVLGMFGLTSPAADEAEERAPEKRPAAPRAPHGHRPKRAKPTR
jgi:hypothetical protein